MIRGRLCLVLAFFIGALGHPFLALGAPIASGETQTGTLIGASTESWTFAGDAGDRVVITTADIGYSTLQPEIWLYAPDDPLNAEASSQGFFSGHHLDHALDHTGEYTITVKDFGANGTGYYAVSLAKIPGPAGPPLDPWGDPIASGETLTGNLSPRADSDIFTFEGTAGHRIILTISDLGSGQIQPDLFLYPPGGGPVENQATGSATSRRLEHSLQQSGTYTVVVTDYLLNGEGDYAIALVDMPGAATSASDPDGGPIASGETLTGTLRNRADTDVFTFEGTAGERIVISTADLSTGPQPEIYLYSPGGGPLEASDVGGSFAEHWLDHQLAETGSYTIVVHDYGLNGEGAYALALAKMGGPSSSATDPDGGPISSGATLAGTLSGQADTDLFQFHGVAGERVVVTIASLSTGVQPEIRLYPPRGGLLEASALGSLPGKRLESRLLADGVYTILVSDNGLNSEGNYAVALATIPGASSSPEDTDGGWISSGKSRVCSLTGRADTDLFQFYGQEGDLVKVTASRYSYGGGSAEPEIWLYPAGGDEAEATATGPGGSHSLDHTLSRTGLYTIMVSDYSLDGDGTCSVSLSKTPSTAPPGIYDVFPPNGAATSELTDPLRWAVVTDATGYDVYLGSDQLAPPELVAAGLTSPFYPETGPNGLQTPRTYRWRVVAHTPAGDLEGPVNWFTTRSAPVTALDDFTEGDQNGAPDWVKVLGVWRVSPAKRLYSLPSIYNGVLLTNQTVYANLSGALTGTFDAKVSLSTTYKLYPDAQLLFGYQDSLHYRYLRLRQGRLQIGQMGTYNGDREGIRKSRPYDVTPGSWYEVRLVILPDGWVKAYLKTRAQASFPFLPTLSAKFTKPAAGFLGFAAFGAKSLFDDFSALVNCYIP